MKLGFSHPVIFSPPVTVTLTVPKPTTIIIDGCDRQQVGLVAAQIKAFYPIEPYKGKGIYIQGESVIRKEAKSSAK